MNNEDKKENKEDNKEDLKGLLGNDKIPSPDKPNNSDLFLDILKNLKENGITKDIQGKIVNTKFEKLFLNNKENPNNDTTKISEESLKNLAKYLSDYSDKPKVRSDAIDITKTDTEDKTDKTKDKLSKQNIEKKDKLKKTFLDIQNKGLAHVIQTSLVKKTKDMYNSIFSKKKIENKKIEQQDIKKNKYLEGISKNLLDVVDNTEKEEDVRKDSSIVPVEKTDLIPDNINKDEKTTESEKDSSGIVKKTLLDIENKGLAHVIQSKTVNKTKDIYNSIFSKKKNKVKKDKTEELEDKNTKDTLDNKDLVNKDSVSKDSVNKDSRTSFIDLFKDIFKNKSEDKNTKEEQTKKDNEEKQDRKFKDKNINAIEGISKSILKLQETFGEKSSKNNFKDTNKSNKSNNLKNILDKTVKNSSAIFKKIGSTFLSSSKGLLNMSKTLLKGPMGQAAAIAATAYAGYKVGGVIYDKLLKSSIDTYFKKEKNRKEKIDIDNSKINQDKRLKINDDIKSGKISKKTGILKKGQNEIKNSILTELVQNEKITSDEAKKLENSTADELLKLYKEKSKGVFFDDSKMKEKSKFYESQLTRLETNFNKKEIIKEVINNTDLKELKKEETIKELKPIKITNKINSLKNKENNINKIKEDSKSKISKKEDSFKEIFIKQNKEIIELNKKISNKNLNVAVYGDNRPSPLTNLF